MPFFGGGACNNHPKRKGGIQKTGYTIDLWGESERGQSSHSKMMSFFLNLIGEDVYHLCCTETGVL